MIDKRMFLEGHLDKNGVCFMATDDAYEQYLETERNMEERKAKGMLWTDTPEAMEAQKKARGLAFDFNHLHPSKADERAL